MRTKKLIMAIFLQFLLIFPAISQSAFDYLRQALLRAIVVSGLQQNYEYKEGISLIGSLLRSGTSQSFTMAFEAGSNYLIIGVADEDINDLDLSIEDQYGNPIVRDRDRDAYPILRFAPYFSGNRTIRITNYESDNISFCIIVVLEERRYNNNRYPSTELLTEALDNVIDYSEIYSLSGTEFTQQTICLFGGLYNSGESDGIINYSIPYNYGGNYTIIGAGSNNCEDIDIEIIRQSSSSTSTSTTICSDTDNSSIAISTCGLYSTNYYNIRYRNYRSTGKAFVFCTVMKNN